MKFLVINGPNLNLLGLREPAIYGSRGTLPRCRISSAQRRAKRAWRSSCSSPTTRARSSMRSRRAYGTADGIVINPAAYTHTSVAILDALKAVALPAVEVHLSDVSTREPFRQISYAGMACVKTYMGLGFEGYRQAILYLRQYLEEANA